MALAIVRVRPGCVVTHHGLTYYQGLEFTPSAARAAELERAGLVDRMPMPEQWRRRLPATEAPAAA